MRDRTVALAEALRRMERVPLFGWELTRVRLLNHRALRRVTDGKP